MSIAKTRVRTWTDGRLEIERYGLFYTRDEARELRDAIDRELNRASGTAEPVEEKIAGQHEAGSGV